MIFSEAETLTSCLNPCLIIFPSWQVKCPRWCPQSCIDHVSVRPWTNISSWSLITGQVLVSTADGQQGNITAWKGYAALSCSLQWFNGRPTIVNPPLSAVLSSWVNLNPALSVLCAQIDQNWCAKTQFRNIQCRDRTEMAELLYPSYAVVFVCNLLTVDYVKFINVQRYVIKD